jgi:hypothetical protein
MIAIAVVNGDISPGITLIGITEVILFRLNIRVIRERGGGEKK